MSKAMLMAASILVGSAFVASKVHAQGAPYDKQVIEMQARIGEDSAKLARYKSMIDQFEKNKKSAADQAQQSADDNKRAAERLANDPQDKKLARKANRAASDAKSDAKKAREASDKLDNLNKDIRKLAKQIEKEQSKLQKYLATATSAAKDSTGQQ